MTNYATKTAAKKTAMFILLFGLTSLASQAAPHHPQDTATTNTPAAFHQWTFKAGGKFEGKPLLFKEPPQVILLGHDSKQYTISLAQLIDADQALLEQMRPEIQRLARERMKRVAESNWDSGARQLTANSYIEVTVKMIDSYPEKVDSYNRFMDAEFVRTDKSDSAFLTSNVRDKNGDSYWHCNISKTGEEVFTKLDDVVQGLSKGDRIRPMETVRCAALTSLTSHSSVFLRQRDPGEECDTVIGGASQARFTSTLQSLGLICQTDRSHVSLKTVICLPLKFTNIPLVISIADSVSAMETAFCAVMPTE